MKLPKAWFQTIVGLAISVAAAIGLSQQLRAVPINQTVVWILVAGVAFGAYLMFPMTVQGFAKTVVIVTPWAKWGKRTEDFPIEEAPPGTKPGDPVKPTPPVEGGDA